MAFVLLPSDLPFWNRLRIHFRNISNLANNDFRLFIDEMKSIFYLCNNCNLDVDNVPEKDDEPFERFRFWLENDLSEREQNLFWSKTVPSLVRWAERLPESKPVSGFYYSLQNQTNCTILSKQFVKSLLANGFFNTFPRRSQKTHPTLTNFNFIEIFRNFNSESQKYKLKSILHFMTNDSFDTKSANLTIKRQTIDFNCPAMFFNYLSNLNSNLCPIEITLKSPQQYIYENSLSTTAATVHVSMDDEQHAINLCQPIRKHFGRHLLTSDSIDSLNCVFFTCPELLICLLFVENLNFNEILSVDNVSDSCKILGFKSQQPEIEFYEQPKTVNIRFMVANKNICDNESFLNEFHKYLYSLQMSCYSSNSFRTRVLDRFHQSSSDLDLSDFNRNSFTSDEYFTANTTLDNSDDDNDMDDDRNYFRRYSNQLSTPDRRLSFAKCIRNVLSNQSSHLTNSTDDSSYAVGIAVTGAEVYDKTIQLRRKGSTGFLLNDQSSFDSEIDDNDDDDDDDDDNDNEIPINELEFDQNYFYNDHLLRRTLSESCNDQKLVANQNHKNLPLFVKSLSLEIEKRRMSQPWPTQMHLSNRNPKFKQKVLIGCSNEESNIDFQLKLIIEWLAASTIGIPQLVYSTHGTNKLTMANIVTCSLFDKNCTISELFALTLDYLEAKLLNQNYKLTLFESLIKYSNKN